MMKSLLYLCLFTSAMISCQCNEKAIPFEAQTPEQQSEFFIEENQRWARQEAKDIDNYIKRHKLKMTDSGTGLRYSIEETGSGEKAKEGQIAVINFAVHLFDGTLCYSTDSIGEQEFRIGMADVESGLHEGVMMMRVGDKAKFILPSHLAHGIAGDRKKIPMRSPIIYDVELLALK